jgi:PAS domain S-box-containing protein
VLDTAVDGVILIDARGAILTFNPACERLFGYRAEEQKRQVSDARALPREA